MRKFVIFPLLLLLAIFIDTNFAMASDLPEQDSFLEKGVVTRIISEKHDKELEKLFNTEQIIQTLNVKILTGDLKDQEVKIKNYITSNPEYDIKIKQGDRVILEKTDDKDATVENDVAEDKTEQSSKANDDDDTINIAAKDNSPILILFTGLFLLSMLLLGGFRGMKALVFLGFSGLLIGLFLIPAILTGLPIIPSAIGVAIACAVFGIFVINGLNPKSLCAAAGASISLVLAGLLSGLVFTIASIHNVETNEGMALLNQYPSLNFCGILTASIIISTIGALVSVATAISNYIFKVKGKHEEYGFKKLFEKGSEAGKEAVGTMVSALIFAFLGSALPLFILATIVPFLKFINLSAVIVELSAAVVGGLVIILCSPITAAIAAAVLRKSTQTEEV